MSHMNHMLSVVEEDLGNSVERHGAFEPRFLIENVRNSQFGQSLNFFHEKLLFANKTFLVNQKNMKKNTDKKIIYYIKKSIFLLSIFKDSVFED